MCSARRESEPSTPCEFEKGDLTDRYNVNGANGESAWSTKRCAHGEGVIIIPRCFQHLGPPQSWPLSVAYSGLLRIGYLFLRVSLQTRGCRRVSFRSFLVGVVEEHGCFVLVGYGSVAH